MQFLLQVDVRVDSRFCIPQTLKYLIKVEHAFRRKIAIFMISRIHIAQIQKLNKKQKVRSTKSR